MQQQRSKLRPRSRLARAGGSGAWEEEEEAGLGHPSGCSAGGRRLQHQGGSNRSRLAAAAAAAAESDEEVVSAAEVLAELLPMGYYYEADSMDAEQQDATTHHGTDAPAAVVAAAGPPPPPPPPMSSAVHHGEVLQYLAHRQCLNEAARNSRAVEAEQFRRSGPGRLGDTITPYGNPSHADDLNKRGPATGSKHSVSIPSLKHTATAAPGVCQLMPPQQQGLSPAATAKAGQAHAAAAAGTINLHVYHAILTALAAGVSAESIDVGSTQRKYEVMEQQLHVPHSPAAAHLLSRMHGISP
jgi:hypothetical protein